MWGLLYITAVLEKEKKIQQKTSKSELPATKTCVCVY